MKTKTKASDPVRPIKDQIDLFHWLFDEVAKNDPQIAVGEYLHGAIEQFRNTIGLRDEVRWLYESIHWDEILSGIEYNTAPEDAAYTCSRDLLMVVGFWGDVIRHHTKPIQTEPAIETLFDYFDQRRGIVLKFHVSKKKKRWSIRGTEDCAAKYGVRIKVKLDEAPMLDAWNVERWKD